MPSMKAIKRRITSVKNTQQIMKAMNLVAASKLQKNKNKLEVVRPFFEEAKHFLAHTAPRIEAEESPFYTTREAKRSAYVVITGERGLCGSYNANVLKEALNHMEGKNEKIISVGAKGKEYFVRRRKHIHEEHLGVMDRVSYPEASAIGEALGAMFNATDEAERVDEVFVAYTRFETILSHEPCVVQLLPFTSVRDSAVGVEIYEPDVETYLRKAVPIYMSMFIYGAMVESATCGEASRMTSMDAAARNAGEILEDITLEYNRKRQSAITQEINEIVSGANAL